VLRFFSRPLAEADAVESTSGEVNVQAVSVRPGQSKSAFFPCVCLSTTYLPARSKTPCSLLARGRPTKRDGSLLRPAARLVPVQACASLHCRPGGPPFSLFLGGAATSPSVHPHPAIAPPGCPVGGASGQRSHPPIRPLSARVLVKGDAQEVPAPGPTHPPSDAHFSPLAWPGLLEVPSRA